MMTTGTQDQPRHFKRKNALEARRSNLSKSLADLRHGMNHHFFRSLSLSKEGQNSISAKVMMKIQEEVKEKLRQDLESFNQLNLSIQSGRDYNSNETIQAILKCHKMQLRLATQIRNARFLYVENSGNGEPNYSKLDEIKKKFEHIRDDLSETMESYKPVDLHKLIESSIEDFFNNQDLPTKAYMRYCLFFNGPGSDSFPAQSVEKGIMKFLKCSTTVSHPKISAVFIEVQKCVKKTRFRNNLEFLILGVCKAHLEKTHSHEKVKIDADGAQQGNDCFLTGSTASDEVAGKVEIDGNRANACQNTPVLFLKVKLHMLKDPMRKLFEESIKNQFKLHDRQVDLLRKRIENGDQVCKVFFFLEGCEKLRSEFRMENLFLSNRLQELTHHNSMVMILYCGQKHDYFQLIKPTSNNQTNSSNRPGLHDYFQLIEPTSNNQTNSSDRPGLHEMVGYSLVEYTTSDLEDYVMTRLVIEIRMSFEKKYGKFDIHSMEYKTVLTTFKACTGGIESCLYLQKLFQTLDPQAFIYCDDDLDDDKIAQNGQNYRNTFSAQHEGVIDQNKAPQGCCNKKESEIDKDANDLVFELVKILFQFQDTIKTNLSRGGATVCADEKGLKSKNTLWQETADLPVLINSFDETRKETRKEMESIYTFDSQPEANLDPGPSDSQPEANLDPGPSSISATLDSNIRAFVSSLRVRRIPLTFAQFRSRISKYDGFETVILKSQFVPDIVLEILEDFKLDQDQGIHSQSLKTSMFQMYLMYTTKLIERNSTNYQVLFHDKFSIGQKQLILDAWICMKGLAIALKEEGALIFECNLACAFLTSTHNKQMRVHSLSESRLLTSVEYAEKLIQEILPVTPVTGDYPRMSGEGLYQFSHASFVSFLVVVNLREDLLQCFKKTHVKQEDFQALLLYLTSNTLPKDKEELAKLRKIIPRLPSLTKSILLSSWKSIDLQHEIDSESLEEKFLLECLSEDPDFLECVAMLYVLARITAMQRRPSSQLDVDGIEALLKKYLKSSGCSETRNAEQHYIYGLDLLFTNFGVVEDSRYLESELNLNVPSLETCNLAIEKLTKSNAFLEAITKRCTEMEEVGNSLQNLQGACSQFDSLKAVVCEAHESVLHLKLSEIPAQLDALNRSLAMVSEVKGTLETLWEQISKRQGESLQTAQAMEQQCKSAEISLQVLQSAEQSVQHLSKDLDVMTRLEESLRGIQDAKVPERLDAFSVRGMGALEEGLATLISKVEQQQADILGSIDQTLVGKCFMMAELGKEMEALTEFISGTIADIYQKFREANSDTESQFNMLKSGIDGIAGANTSLVAMVKEQEQTLLSQTEWLAEGCKGVECLRQSLDDLQAHDLESRLKSFKEKLAEVKTVCEAYEEVRVPMNEGLNSLRAGVDGVARLDATLQSMPSEIEPISALIMSQLAEMRAQSRRALSLSEVLQNSSAGLDEAEIRGLTSSLMSSLEGARRMNQMLQGLPDIALRARDMGMPTEVERLNQGLAAFNGLLSKASMFQRDVKRLGEMWKRSNLGTLVDQNRAWLSLVKNPMHILGQKQQHKSATRVRVTPGATARQGTSKHTSDAVHSPGSVPAPAEVTEVEPATAEIDDSQSDKVREPLPSTAGRKQGSLSPISLQALSPAKNQNVQDVSLEIGSRMPSTGTIASPPTAGNSVRSTHVVDAEARSTDGVQEEAGSLKPKRIMAGSFDGPMEITDLEKHS